MEPFVTKTNCGSSASRSNRHCSDLWLSRCGRSYSTSWPLSSALRHMWLIRCSLSSALLCSFYYIMGKTTLFPAQRKFYFFYPKAFGKCEGLASNFWPMAVCGGHRSAINLAFALNCSRYLYHVNKTVSYSTAVKNKVYKNVTLHLF